MDFDSTILHVEIHCVLIRSIQARFQHTRTIFDPSLYRVILIPAYNISLDLSVLHRAIVLRGSWMFEHYGAVSISDFILSDCVFENTEDPFFNSVQISLAVIESISTLPPDGFSTTIDLY